MSRGRRRFRPRKSLVIEAAKGNLFRKPRPPRIGRTLARQFKRDLTDLGRGMLFLGPRRRRRRK
jgi:hypothetical protein